PVQGNEPFAQALVAQVVQPLQDDSRDDVLAIGSLQHSFQLQRALGELPGVVEEEPVQEVKEEDLKVGDELAEGERGQVSRRVVRSQSEEARLVDGRAGRQVRDVDDVPLILEFSVG